MSDYQACWIPDAEELDEAEEDDDDEDDDESDFMSCNSNANSEDEFEKDDQPEEFDDISVSEAPVADDKYDQDLDLREETETFEKIKQARLDQMWPDEIDTPMDTNARTRFQKYRGLESFRWVVLPISTNSELCQHMNNNNLFYHAELHHGMSKKTFPWTMLAFSSSRVSTA